MTPLPLSKSAVALSVVPSGDTSPLVSNEVVRFPHGLPGFEACRGFVLMTSDALGPLQCLKSVEGPPASFLVIDPRRVLPDYRCELTDADRRRLAVTEEDTLLWLSLVTIELDGTITVNLRAPVVINPAQMVGHQVVPHNTVYPIRHIVAAAE